jgi:hypothetical protein
MGLRQVLHSIRRDGFAPIRTLKSPETSAVEGSGDLWEIMPWPVFPQSGHKRFTGMTATIAIWR